MRIAPTPDLGRLKRAAVEVGLRGNLGETNSGRKFKVGFNKEKSERRDSERCVSRCYLMPRDENGTGPPCHMFVRACVKDI